MEVADRPNIASILLVSNSTAYRQAIARSLSDDGNMMVVADVGTIEVARHVLTANEIDVVVSDISLVDESGLAFAEEVKTAHPNTKVVLMSMRDDEEAFLAAVRIGIDGYVLESSTYEQLLAALRSVLDGGCAYDPVVCNTAIRRLAVNNAGDSASQSGFQMDVTGLSYRERQVLALMSKGMANKEIARELGISISTTKTHISKIFRHLGISSRRELLPRFYKLA